MPLIKYIEANETVHEVDVPVGVTLMQAALDIMIEGIVGECGGGCSCATCHVFVMEPEKFNLPAPSPIETLLLENLAEVRPNSRLSCQIQLSEELDGLVVYLPERQI